jgi:hypothetical protein
VHADVAVKHGAKLSAERIALIKMRIAFGELLNEFGFGHGLTQKQCAT